MKTIFKGALGTFIQNCENFLQENLLNEYRNPYYWWWKVRKYWKRPKMHLAHVGKITWWYGLPCNTELYNKYFSVKLMGLGWKNKHDAACFEWNPYLCFTLFRKWQLIFMWSFRPHFIKSDSNFHGTIENELTWEAIVEMVWKNKTVSDACHDVGEAKPYDTCNDSDYYIPSRVITPFRNLTNYGWLQYYETPRSKQLRNNNLKNYEQGNF